MIPVLRLSANFMLLQRYCNREFILDNCLFLVLEYIGNLKTWKSLLLLMIRAVTVNSTDRNVTEGLDLMFSHVLHK
jgi:hypothetical protein